MICRKVSCIHTTYMFRACGAPVFSFNQGSRAYEVRFRDQGWGVKV